MPTYSADRIALRQPFHVAAINGHGDLAGRKDVGERRGGALAINSAGVAVGYGTVVRSP